MHQRYQWTIAANQSTRRHQSKQCLENNFIYQNPFPSNRNVYKRPALKIGTVFPTSQLSRGFSNKPNQFEAEILLKGFRSPFHAGNFIPPNTSKRTH